ncbi:MAG: pectic acid lyase [Candidatus Hydrogenedentes bacterium]|nr:pectic acid lyase [Candidatus Hydrogenedentota bacterium]
MPPRPLISRFFQEIAAIRASRGRFGVVSCCFAGLFICLLHPLAWADPAPSRDEAADALRRGVAYFRDTVSIEGGYLWRYAADFSEVEGEVPATRTAAWAQPPGTPSVGLAYVTVYELTRDPYYLEAARETATALVRTQLDSGGWDYRLEFAPEDRKKYRYRVESDHNENARNTSTLDDDTTQAALRCLMRVDQALEFSDRAIHEAATYALKKLMEAQYPNGAWPQRFSGPPDPANYPVKPASYPEDWPKAYPNAPYADFYTFNDNTLADTLEVMFMAGEIYQNDAYTRSGRRAGDFMILAQMPDPQPGWAQQYNADMHPAWARKFEPASITGGESQGVMRSLLRVYELTGDRKYLAPLPRALTYYKASLLEDGRLARFYELKTNTPLYFTKDYEVTYSDADMPTHYSFKSPSQLDAIEAHYEQLAAIPEGEWTPRRLVRPATPGKTSDVLADQAAKILKAQREDGAWVEPAPARDRSRIEKGTPMLDARTFSRNIVTLARFIAA